MFTFKPFSNHLKFKFIKLNSNINHYRIRYTTCFALDISDIESCCVASVTNHKDL